MASALLTAFPQASTAQVAKEDCVIVDQLDTIWAIQTRLYRNPATALFTNDIRQLRQITGRLSNSDAIQVVGGTSISGKGATFRRFLDDTRDLLRRTSLDDPFSTRPHFTAQVLNRLSDVEQDLLELRCDAQQIAIATRERSERGFSGEDIGEDVEDIEVVRETLAEYREQVMQPRNFVILFVVGGAAMVLTPLIRKWLIWRRRKAKRHNTSYATTYQLDERKLPGMLIDINCFGTKLKHGLETPPEVGAVVEIDILDQTTPGAVKWANTHYVGVQFDQQISLGTVGVIVNQARETQTAPA
ncbi:MAG: PilZ domain-containing protein [Pseudomonadota bacterium]